MSTFLIRFNKSRGQPGRGSADHVWRVFKDGKEFLCKHVNIQIPLTDVRTGDDWSLTGQGEMTIDKETSTIIIKGENRCPYDQR